MKTKHVQQPTGSNLCGQCCVAMIKGCSVKELTKTMGSGKTRTSHICNGLGVKKQKLKRISSKYTPKNAIYRIVWKSGNAHWVLKVGSMIHDPLNFMPISYLEYNEWLKNRGRITSYLELT